MSPKRWVLLLIFYVSYLMFGASIYYHIEHGLEKQSRREKLDQRIEIYEYLLEELADKSNSTQQEIFGKISDYCGKPVTDYNSDENIPYTWTFYHAFFFAFTVCSTVGYGNISPSTTLGRMIMIAYSLIGIPVNGILFAGLGEFFGRTFESIYRRYKDYKMSKNKHYVPPKLGLITIVMVALIPGITLFILLPSWVFTFFEGWDYSISVYYSYVTTTTIGFGDFVPTFNPTQPTEFGGWFVVYEIFIIVWFIFALGYLVMIMTFITRGLQSKKLAHLEHQLSSNIKATQNRVWNGVTKDVGYLRRILNELYILKFKPVYNEPDFAQNLHRSISCPELTMYRIDPAPENLRKRAFSECYDAFAARADGTPIVHAASDTDINKFDKQRSFETADAFRQTTDLLAKVVNALAIVQPPRYDEPALTVGSAGMFGGYHGFSDSEILASEWSFSTIHDTPKPRDRARSDFNINPKWQIHRPSAIHNEWTWSGDNNQIQEAINIRHKERDRHQFGEQPPDYIVNVDDEEFKKPRPKKFSIPDGIRRLFPFKKGATATTTTDLSSTNIERKCSIVSVPEKQFNRQSSLDYYNTVTANASPTYFDNDRDKIMESPTSSVPMPSLQINGNKLPKTDNNYDTENSTLTSNSYQRNAMPLPTRKRRESIFAQNPVTTSRHGSMFQSNNAAALSQRRTSLFNIDRASTVSLAPTRRGSLFPTPTTSQPSMHANERRSSLFSVASEKDMEVLENTTLADLIRALEVMHTQAIMDDGANDANVAPPQRGYDLDMIFGGDRKRRKTGTAGLDIQGVPPIVSLFGGDSKKALNAAAANRLYARRSTVVGTLPISSMALTQTQQQQQQQQLPMDSSRLSTSNILTRRRKSSSIQIVEPPPSYSEKETTSNVLGSTITSAGPTATKFRRRFSVRPTALQIPPGKAPPPPTTTNATTSAATIQQQPQITQSTMLGLPSQAINAASVSQTALQRRLSLRPSPLARELNITTTSHQPAGSANVGAVGGINNATATSTTRLLPPAATATRSHSPLSRMAQITQAQRKSSMPDRLKKPDGKS